METIYITGNIGQDAVVETFGNDTVIRFRVAANRRWTDRSGQQMERTTWYSCSYWNVRPELAGFLLQGRRIMVQGVPENHAYQNKNDLQWYVSNDIRVVLHELQDANPNNRQGAALNIPAGAVVNQPSNVAPSQYHMQQQQQAAAVTAPNTIAMPERVTQPVSAQEQPPLFPNAAPALPENDTLSGSTPETQGIVGEPVTAVKADLPY